MHFKSLSFIFILLCMSLNAIAATDGRASGDSLSTSLQLVPPTGNEPDKGDGEGGKGDSDDEDEDEEGADE